jgi:hypothetical protein
MDSIDPVEAVEIAVLGKDVHIVASPSYGLG